MLKWICHGVMALVLLLALLVLSGFQMIKLTSLTGVDDIAMVPITVKTVQLPPFGPSFSLQSEEYPTLFSVFQLEGLPGSSLLAASSLHVGQRLQIGVKKEWAGNLGMVPMAQVYVVALEDGTKLMDDSGLFGQQLLRPSLISKLETFFWQVAAVPVIYFLVILGWYLVRRTAAKRAPEAR